MGERRRRHLWWVGGAFAVLLAGLPAGAQISSQQVRERYERNTKGSSIDDYVRKLGSDDPETRLEGVKSLGETNDGKAVEYLIQAVGDPDLRVKAKAIDALGDMRATDATPVLIQQLFLRDADLSVKRRILASLGKIGDPRAARPIMELLQRDLDTETRGTAIYALGDIGSVESLEVLSEIEQTEEDPTLRRLAREADSKVRYHHAQMQNEAKQPLETFLRTNEPAPPQ